MIRRMSWFLWFLILLGCAHGKMGQVDQALASGAITKTTPIYVEPVSAQNVKFSGDKAAETKRTDEEKATIQQRYNQQIAEALRKKGFNAKAVTERVNSGIVLVGSVSRFEHGSAAARMMVGMGAGSSNLFTDFKIEERGQAPKVLSKFEVIATSGGRGGWSAGGSFMEAHLSDGAEKVAEYVEKSK